VTLLDRFDLWQMTHQHTVRLIIFWTSVLMATWMAYNVGMSGLANTCRTSEELEQAKVTEKQAEAIEKLHHRYRKQIGKPKVD
jgi:hypothetical protein